MDDILAARLRCFMSAEDIVRAHGKPYGPEDILSVADMLYDWMIQDHEIVNDDDADEFESDDAA